MWGKKNISLAHCQLALVLICSVLLSLAPHITCERVRKEKESETVQLSEDILGKGKSSFRIGGGDRPNPISIVVDTAVFVGHVLPQSVVKRVHSIQLEAQDAPYLVHAPLYILYCVLKIACP
jgi:C4-dicarboxylate transporter